MSSNPYQRPAADHLSAAGTPSHLLGRQRLLRGVRVFLCVLPLVHYLYVVLFWLAASAALRQPVQPGLHDPSSFAFGIPHAVHMVLMLSSLAVAPIVVTMGYRQRSMALYLGGYGICLVLMFVLFRADYAQITTWIAD